MYLQVVSAFALSNKNDLIRDDYHKLMRAFRALDPEKKGYIDAELFGGLMSSRGESFSTQETNTMLRYVLVHLLSQSTHRLLPYVSWPRQHQAPGWACMGFCSTPACSKLWMADELSLSHEQ